MTMLPRFALWLTTVVLVMGAQPAWAQADLTVAFPTTPLFENGMNTYAVLISNDPDNNAQLAVTGSNSQLVPPESLIIQGSGANRVVFYRPPLDRSGVTNLTFTLRDPAVVDTVTQTGLQILPVTAVPRAPAAVVATGGTLATFQVPPVQTGAASDLPSYYMLEVGDGPGLTATTPIRVPARTQAVQYNLPRGGYNFRLRPGNRLGLGTVSPEGSVDVAGGPNVPGPPGGVAIALSPSNVATVTWAPPGFGPTPTHYVLEAGTASGASNIGRFALPPTFSLSANVAPGKYYVRMRAVGGAGEGLASGEVVLSVPGGACAPPSAPVLSTFLRNGPTLMVPWSAPPTGDAHGYTIVAGTSPGASNIAVLPVGPGSSFVLNAPPSGIYYVYVQARSSCGDSPPSNVVAYVEPPPGPPGAPTALTATTGPGRATLAWRPALTGGRVDRYWVAAGFTPGAMDVVVPLDKVSGQNFTGVPSGTYYVRIHGVNAFGPSPASNEVVLTVP